MIRIILSGCYGKMGRAILDMLPDYPGMQIVAGVDTFANPASPLPYPVFSVPQLFHGAADVIIDFSRPEALPGLLAYATENSLPLVLATTGYSEADMQLIREAAQKTAIFQSGNMSLGVNLMLDLLKTSTKILGDHYDIELIEKHHNQKVDSPSGTALMMADAINQTAGGGLVYTYDRHNLTHKRGKRELGIHSIRGGTIVGEHTVIFAGQDEFFEITHKAQSRRIFASGALQAAAFLPGKPAGLYAMHNLISIDLAVTRATCEEGLAVLSVLDLPAQKSLSAVLEALAAAKINVDIISRNLPAQGKAAVTVSLHSRDAKGAQEALQALGQVVCHPEAVKITVEGMGMEHQPGAAARFFAVLERAGIPVLVTTTSETKIACAIAAPLAGEALRLLKEEFGIQK